MGPPQIPSQMGPTQPSNQHLLSSPNHQDVQIGMSKPSHTPQPHSVKEAEADQGQGRNVLPDNGAAT